MHTELRQHLDVGRAYYKANDYLAAIPHLRAVLNERAGYADVHNMLGVMTYDLGRPQEALQYFEQAVALNPSYTEAALHLSICYNEQGRYADARYVLQQTVHPEESVRSDRRAADQAAKAKIANLHGELGDAYVAAGERNKALTNFHTAVETCPGFPDLRLKLAITLRDAGRNTESLHTLLALRRDHPSYLPARMQLGIALHQAKRLDEAREEWLYVLQKRPDHPCAAFYLERLTLGKH